LPELLNAGRLLVNQMNRHPIDDQEEFSEFLNIAEKMKLTHHFRVERLPRRPKISEELIKAHIENPESLLEFQYSDDEHSREKYECLFEKSSKYLLKIVLSVENRTIFIVTAHLVNKSRKNSLEELL